MYLSKYMYHIKTQIAVVNEIALFEQIFDFDKLTICFIFFSQQTGENYREYKKKNEKAMKKYFYLKNA